VYRDNEMLMKKIAIPIPDEEEVVVLEALIYIGIFL
jgi:hypothetical protein